MIISASTPITAADLMQAPRFRGSIMLSRIKIRGLSTPELIKFLRSLKFNSFSLEIIASGSCFSFDDKSKLILFFSNARISEEIL